MLRVHGGQGGGQNVVCGIGGDCLALQRVVVAGLVSGVVRLLACLRCCGGAVAVLVRGVQSGRWSGRWSGVALSVPRESQSKPG